jgi:hypothetical protein
MASQFERLFRRVRDFQKKTQVVELTGKGYQQLQKDATLPRALD